MPAGALCFGATFRSTCILRVTLWGAKHFSPWRIAGYQMLPETCGNEAFKRREDTFGNLLAYLETKRRIHDDPMQIASHQVQNQPWLRLVDEL